MNLQDSRTQTAEGAGLDVRLARTPGEIRAALRLRYAVFGEEMGASIPGGAETGLDHDRFDPHCDHLIVTAQPSGAVVGTYRVLPPAGRRRAGGWYCGDEFDVSGLQRFADDTIEIGRACVAPAYRSGHAITLLWAGLLRHIVHHGGAYVIGCVSIGTEDGGHVAASVCRRVLQDHPAAPAWRVTPRRAFVLEGWREIADAPLPPLLKGYLRLGAQVCGPPAWDPDFNTADLLMMLAVGEINPRYVERLRRN